MPNAAASVNSIPQSTAQVHSLTIGKTTYLVTSNYSGKESIDKKIAKLIERKLESGQ